MSTEQENYMRSPTFSHVTHHDFEDWMMVEFFWWLERKLNTLFYDCELLRRSLTLQTLPPHSSICVQIASTVSEAILRMLFIPSRTTCMTCVSLTLSRLQNGGMTPSWTTCATWWEQNKAIGETGGEMSWLKGYQGVGKSFTEEGLMLLAMQ